MTKTNSVNFYLELNVNDQSILLSLNTVEIVLPMATLQYVPDKNHLLKGLLNYHGTAIPVYDLAELLEMEKTETDINTPLILVDMNNKKVGIFLKEVQNVIEVDDDVLQKPDLCKMKQYVSGIYETTDDNAWRLDLPALFSYHQLYDEVEHVDTH